MLRVVIGESQVSRFWQKDAGQQQFVAYLPVFFNILKYLSILFNILLIAVWRVIPAIKFAVLPEIEISSLNIYHSYCIAFLKVAFFFLFPKEFLLQLARTGCCVFCLYFLALLSVLSVSFLSILLM